MSSLTVSPDGAELLALLRGEQDGSARRRAPRIYADAFGLRFEMLPEPHEKWGTAVRGPYCLSCRRIQGQASFTDWSTAERRTSSIPERCPHCGVVFSAPESDGLALATLVAKLFHEHVARLAASS
jgi:hypothetical protein